MHIYTHLGASMHIHVKNFCSLQNASLHNKNSNILLIIHLRTDLVHFTSKFVYRPKLRSSICDFSGIKNFRLQNISFMQKNVLSPQHMRNQIFDFFLVRLFSRDNRDPCICGVVTSTLRLKSLLPLPSVWSKTTLNTGGMGGAREDPPTCKMGTFFVISLTLTEPSLNNFQLNGVKMF